MGRWLQGGLAYEDAHQGFCDGRLLRRLDARIDGVGGVLRLSAEAPVMFATTASEGLIPHAKSGAPRLPMVTYLATRRLV